MSTEARDQYLGRLRAAMPATVRLSVGVGESEDGEPDAYFMLARFADKRAQLATPFSEIERFIGTPPELAVIHAERMLRKLGYFD